LAWLVVVTLSLLCAESAQVDDGRQRDGSQVGERAVCGGFTRE
jgi:hypothetical protein